ncbi:cytochrome P450 [Mycena leptocephala]|nr:cytochrome P450 [Mycena leptocephala]
MSAWPYLASLIAIYAIRQVFQFRANAQKLSYLPGLRSMLSPVSAFGALIPTCFWNPGLNWQWEWRNQVYSKYGLQTISVLALWGKNLFTENGAEWSRHRRIMNPAFTPETFFALILIARCGFGQPISWDMPPPTSGGMPFAEALVIVSGSSIARLVTPRWMYMLPIKRLRDIETATRRKELAEEQYGNLERKDLFRLMIRASEGEEKLQMTDDELAGNTFLMLFAGHETTAKTLDAAIGFLALYEDIQEEVYQEIRAVMSLDGKLLFKHYGQLVKVRSCFLEAARLFPAGFTMYRETTETLVLKTDEEDGHGGQIILEPGTRLAVDVVGLPLPRPEEFRPSRWYGASESDMTMFSLGPRACIGRKFALTEGVAFLSNLLRDWKLHVVLNAGETRAQWRARVMRGVSGMTLGVGEVPVRLTRR